MGINLKKYEILIAKKMDQFVVHYSNRFPSILEYQLRLPINSLKSQFDTIFTFNKNAQSQREATDILSEIVKLAKDSYEGKDCEQREKLLTKEIESRFNSSKYSFYDIYGIASAEEDGVKNLFGNKIRFPDEHKAEYLRYVHEMSGECASMLCNFIKQKLTAEEQKDNITRQDSGSWVEREAKRPRTDGVVKGDE